MPSKLFIKRLEISGFKTFVRRTVVQCDPGLTGIVGPNGCGKSNIIDAVRWVLGEQSARAIRAARMEEVIFHGSDREKPVGMAEVTMTLDNEEGVMKSQGPEISVTRRLYRSGESEYLINRSPVRLKDITDLLLDTGVSTGAYIIMEQGKIDQVLTARPTERMSLFQEAAGVMRYQQQKEEAERKLAATQTNLQRVGDIVFELKRQLDSLERQAKAAEQYREMQTRVRELKARTRAIDLATARDALREVEAMVAAVRQEQEVARATAADRSGTARAARDRLEAADSAARELESQLGRVRDENQAAYGALEAMRLKVGQLAVTRTERESRLAEAAGRRERVSARAQRAEAEAAEDEARLTQVHAELADFSKETRRLEEETGKARADLASRRSQLGTQADALHQQPGAEGTTGPLAEFRERAPSLEWPLVSVFRADDAKRSAIQAALGPFADAAIVETWAQARALLAAWRDLREAPLALVVLEALGEPKPRGELPAGALGWADELVECAPRHAALARALLGEVAIIEGDPENASSLTAVASLSGVRWTAPGYVWWPGKLPVTAKTTGTELAMLLAAAVRELGGIEARIVELEADLAEARRFESAARIEEARLSQRLQGRKGEREELVQTATESAAIEGRLREEIDQLQRDHAQLEAELRAREEGGDSSRRRQDELTGQQLGAQDAVKRAREALNAIEDELEEARRRSESAQVTFVEAESKAGEARTRFELAKHDFEAEFPGEAERIDDLAGRPLTDEEREELRKKDARLTAMGEAVNLLALEEFTSLKDRYAEYQKQIEDLRSSREKLQRAIYRLDRESERRFDETFAQIRKNFHAMFRRLFGGGDADLRLTENEEGERGIEIDAKPPGKRTQSIALLSGGERALTSTALLFSLYLAKPSPFCFLDELDAPLDDANTDRFMKILKEFNATTQFILITHNKHSMEMTDSLYGITMEEPGISKLVSVRLRQLPQNQKPKAEPEPEPAAA